jgi:hypothetical protein
LTQRLRGLPLAAAASTETAAAVSAQLSGSVAPPDKVNFTFDGTHLMPPALIPVYQKLRESAIFDRGQPLAWSLRHRI